MVVDVDIKWYYICAFLIFNMSAHIWKDLIKDCGNDDAKRIHSTRYQAWLDFMSMYWPPHKPPLEPNPFAGDSTYEYEIQIHTDIKKVKDWLPKNQWKKIIIRDSTKKRVVVFDASFGSIDMTSDFDVVVNSTTTDPLEKWITYLGEWHGKNPGKNFTNYFDSNFYFEPSARTPKGELVSFMNTKMLHGGKDTFIVNDKTCIKFLDAIRTYTNNYIGTNPVIHVYGNDIGERPFFPNPLGMEKVWPAPNNSSKQQHEINQYTLMKLVSGKILTKNEKYLKTSNSEDLRYTADDIIDAAFTKTEALIAPGSLAICNVFGTPTKRNYVHSVSNDSEAPLPWRLVSMYEMLSNMLMHEHDTQIKTKYVGRFLNSVGPLHCSYLHEQINKILTKVEEESKKHEKKHAWKNISGDIFILVELIVFEVHKDQCSKYRTYDTQYTVKSGQARVNIMQALDLLQNYTLWKFGLQANKNAAYQHLVDAKDKHKSAECNRKTNRCYHDEIVKAPLATKISKFRQFVKTM